MSKTAVIPYEFEVFEQYKETNPSEFTNLPDTGWIIIRLKYGWEFIFKCGEGSPKHLPAHTHSDLFSFDLFKNGLPIIAEAGTSFYGNSEIRKFERSSAAHNVLRLSKVNKFKTKKTEWIEPIDVWGNFRAGRKAKVLLRKFEKINDRNYLLIGSHDGFKKIGASYQRNISLFINEKGDIKICIKEKISCKNNLTANQLSTWTNFDPSFFKTSLYTSKLIKNIYSFWKDTHFAVGFGKEFKEKVLLLSILCRKVTNN